MATDTGSNDVKEYCTQSLSLGQDSIVTLPPACVCVFKFLLHVAGVVVVAVVVVTVVCVARCGLAGWWWQR